MNELDRLWETFNRELRAVEKGEKPDETDMQRAFDALIIGIRKDNRYGTEEPDDYPRGER